MRDYLDEWRKVAQTLLEDLANEDAKAMFQGRRVFHIYTPEFGPDAVSKLAQVLEEHATSR